MFKSLAKIALGLCAVACLVSCGDTKQAPKDIAAAGDYTFSIIKPNAVEDNNVGAIIERIEDSGLQVAAIKMLQLSNEQASQFYGIHKDRPFFDELVTFMTRSPVVVMVLYGDDAVPRYRTVMGDTDPANAAPGTIRADFAKSKGENSVHGSDARETASAEIAFFFTEDEIHRKN